MYRIIIAQRLHIIRLITVWLLLFLSVCCNAGNNVGGDEEGIQTLEVDCTCEESNCNHGCVATLTRYRDLGAISISVDDLSGFNEDHAYTIWFMDRHECGDGSGTSCSIYTGNTQLYNLGGFVYTDSDDLELPLIYNVPDFTTAGLGSRPTSCPDELPDDGTCVTYDSTDVCSIIYPMPETCNFGVECDDTDLSGVLALGLINGWRDDITIVFKDHGPSNDDELQTSTFNGGCTEGSIHYPKDYDICPKDDSGYECTDRVRASFGFGEEDE